MGKKVLLTVGGWVGAKMSFSSFFVISRVYSGCVRLILDRRREIRRGFFGADITQAVTYALGSLEIHTSIGTIWPNAIFRFGESSSVFPPGNGVNHPFLPPFQTPLDPIQSLGFLCALQLGFFYPHLRLFPAFQVSPMEKKRPKHIVCPKTEKGILLSQRRRRRTWD